MTISKINRIGLVFFVVGALIVAAVLIVNRDRPTGSTCDAGSAEPLRSANGGLDYRRLGGAEISDLLRTQPGASALTTDGFDYFGIVRQNGANRKAGVGRPIATLLTLVIGTDQDFRDNFIDGFRAETERHGAEIESIDLASGESVLASGPGSVALATFAPCHAITIYAAERDDALEVVDKLVAR